MQFRFSPTSPELRTPEQGVISGLLAVPRPEVVLVRKADGQKRLFLKRIPAL